MGGTDPGSAREEAERLVATVLAAARLAGAGARPGSGAGPWGPLGGIVSSVLDHSAGAARSNPGMSGFATGAAECCVCPVCRGIAALRDPSPEFAERLATGAGDLAAGVASLLRAFAPADGPATTPSPQPAGPASGDDVWREATRTGHDAQPAPEQDVWSAATRGEGRVPAADVPPADDAGPAAPGASRPAAGRPVVPASRAATTGGAGDEAPGHGA
ncbi:hypothetical protein [Micromonospora sp. DT233]|uniref:hypothetical protein n=1 Tax=Micromonospora sp. DT233 TaxID=3393432 RepID=UPI003CFAE56E